MTRFIKKNTPHSLPLWLAGILIISLSPPAWAETRSVSAKALSVMDYPSIQAALDANPGRIITLPAGEYTLSEKLRFSSANSGLAGPGRIIQSNANQPIIDIQNAANVTLSDLILTRSEGAMVTPSEAVVAVKCPNLCLNNLRVLDNRTLSSAIQIRESDGVRIIGCHVENYMRITIDDRTASEDYGYAFNCINGTGIAVSYSRNVLIQGNRVVDLNFVPTRDLMEKFSLGKFVKKNATKGRVVGQKVWDAGYTEAWHQGAGIIVTAPKTSDFVQLLGNSIENAAQGMDIHADHVIVSQNLIRNAFIGMKAMHGARNVLIMGNQFSKNDLWSIGLMPGAASQPAREAKGGVEASPANTDGGSIIANNIISDFGEGSAAWIWGEQGTPIRFDSGQLPENPPLTDIVVQGNIIQSVSKPHYRYAVRIADEARGLHFSNNLFHPGTEAISNMEMKP